MSCRQFGFREIILKIQYFSLKKMYPKILKKLHAKRRQSDMDFSQYAYLYLMSSIQICVICLNHHIQLYNMKLIWLF